MDVSWTWFGHYFLFVVQVIFCVQLYLTQTSIVSRLDGLEDASSQGNSEVRSGRFARSIDYEDVRRRHGHTNRSAVSIPFLDFEATTHSSIVKKKSRKSGKKNVRRTQDTWETDTESAEGKPPIAVHYNALVTNSTKLTLKHRYIANGKLEIGTGLYTYWEEADWVREFGTYNFFHMNRGNVTIEKPGLYLLYAQIHYATMQPINCYSAHVNSATVAQCCSTTSSSDNDNSNTCNLVTTAYLHQGDHVGLNEIHNRRHVILRPEKSFFGLIKLIGH